MPLFLTLIASLLVLSQQPIAATGNSLVLPKLIHRVDRPFSKAAKQAGFHGYVSVNIVIDTEGHVSRAEVRDHSSIPGLDEEALIAARLWRFQPATRNGKPVEIIACVQVVFNGPLELNERPDARVGSARD